MWTLITRDRKVYRNGPTDVACIEFIGHGI